MAIAPDIYARVENPGLDTLADRLDTTAANHRAARDIFAGHLIAIRSGDRSLGTVRDMTIKVYEQNGRAMAMESAAKSVRQALTHV
jgi:hypothetical protein